jgi:hypothetical protein
VDIPHRAGAVRATRLTRRWPGAGALTGGVGAGRGRGAGRERGRRGASPSDKVPPVFWPLIGAFIAFVLFAIFMGWVMDPSRHGGGAGDDTGGHGGH